MEKALEFNCQQESNEKKSPFEKRKLFSSYSCCCGANKLLLMPVSVSVCSLLKTCFVINILAMSPQAATHVYKIHMLRKLHAKASFTASCCRGSLISWMAITLAAADGPASSVTRSTGSRAAWSSGSRSFILFWNTTPPITIDMDVARLRTKPKVAVAAAVSSCEILLCRAIRGGQKRKPAPMPATTWKPITSTRGENGVKSIYNPVPIVRKVVPNQISSRYLPVWWMTRPLATLAKDSVKIMGRIKRPECNGDAPFADWKYKGR